MTNTIYCGKLANPLLQDVADSTVAVTGAVLLFIVPTGRKRGEFLLDWQHASHIPWDILILFGGGLALDGNTILEDSLDGLNIHVGNRFYKNLGVEFGYFRTKEESKSIANGTTVGSGIVTAVDFSTDVKVQGIMLDGLGYLPLDKEGKFELIGTAGLSWSKAEFTATIPGTGSIDADESEIGFRVGGGAQVNFTDNINMRGLVRYQTADFDDVVDNAWTYGLGLNYSF